MFFICIVYGILTNFSFVEDDPADIEFYLVFSLFFLFSLAFSLFYSPQKITVSGKEIIIVSFPKIRSEYTVNDITHLNLGIESLLIFVCEKRIARVRYTSQNFIQLVEFFKENEIPLFDQKHFRIEYDDVFEWESDE
jgi:hypothetical protein